MSGNPDSGGGIWTQTIVSGQKAMTLITHTLKSPTLLEIVNLYNKPSAPYMLGVIYCETCLNLTLNKPESCIKQNS